MGLLLLIGLLAVMIVLDVIRTHDAYCWVFMSPQSWWQVRYYGFLTIHILPSPRNGSLARLHVSWTPNRSATPCP